MTGIAAFIAARLDEWEATAEAAGPGAWREDVEANIQDENGYVACGPWDSGIHDLHRAHLLAHDPARVLREVAALRAIVKRHAPGVSYPDECGFDNDPYPCRDVEDIAAIWADHPGYDERWKP